MIGLPAPPGNVARAQLLIDQDGSASSIASWLFMPELPGAIFSDIDAAAGQVRTALVDLALNLMAAAGVPREFAFQVYGDAPFTIRSTIGGLHGSRGACQAINASTGIYWATNTRGKSGRCITHVPAFPDEFTDDHARLNGTAIDAVRLAAAGYLDALAAVSAGSILSCALCTLHREQGGLPLPSAELRLIDHGIASPLIAGIQRRLSANR